MSLVFADHPTAAHAADEIDSGRFWPRIRLADLRAAGRIDSAITAERLHYAATAAVIYVNRQLAAYQAAALQKGIISLAEIHPENQINGAPVAVYHYRRAVYSYTQAELLETYADYSATAATAERAEAKQAQAGDARREAHGAIADILGRHRTNVELI